MVHCRNIEEATIPFTAFIQVFGTECNPVNLDAILQAFGIKNNEILEDGSEDEEKPQDPPDDEEVLKDRKVPLTIMLLTI